MAITSRVVCLASLRAGSGPDGSDPGAGNHDSPLGKGLDDGVGVVLNAARVGPW